MDRKLRVLVITYLPWRNDTNIGNSYSNIFTGMDDKIEFAHIYFRDGMPENSLVHKYFHISERELVKSIFDRKPVGKAFYLEDPVNTSKVVFSKGYNRIRRTRWESLLLARDMIGRLGRWKSQQLLEFVDEFNPDLIFGTLTYIPVINHIMIYLKKYLRIPLITYPWDDFYSLKRLSWSPMFWIRILSERQAIRKTALASEYLYTITGQMQKEYERYFHKECRILYKGYHFEGEPDEKTECAEPIQMVYMGNIGSGRWKVLGKLAKAVFEVNKQGKKIELWIYTLSPLNSRIEKELNIENASRLMPAVPNEEVLNVMSAADVLLHVEPTTLKDRLFFRLSFSTKIVDYLFCGRCILAVGGQTAAMDYLKENDAAIIEQNENDYVKMLRRLADDSQIIIEYGKKAWKCGKRNHDITMIQNRIYMDFTKIVCK
ncbi:MAG: glycosyltransferase [Lachnoclostridium sp.]|nr:glycosyltransferase [Lachnospira sp.]MCM1248465.1 glycosyltransferase [Lachnoclostridium sp.]